MLVPFFLILSNAFADWKFWAIADNNDRYFFDPTTIKKISPSKRRVWIYQELNKPSTKDFEYKSIKGYEEYDCKEESYRTLQMIAYKNVTPEGELFDITSNPDQIRYISPGTVRSDLLKSVCK